MPGQKPLVAFNEVRLIPEYPLFNWEIRPGENWHIPANFELAVNELFKILAGKKKVPSGTLSQTLVKGETDAVSVLAKNTAFVNFLHPSTLLPEAFYQQRYHASESDKGQTLLEFITDQAKSYGIINQRRTAEYNGIDLIHLFGLDGRLDEPILHLSTGEFRKLSMVIGLLKEPRLLLLLEPYSGLDGESIELLDSILLEFSKKRINIILASSLDHIPEFITNCLRLNHSDYSISVRTKQNTVDSLKYFQNRVDSVGTMHSISQLKSERITDIRQKELVSFEFELSKYKDFSFETAFSLHDLTIQDGPKKFLDSVNWSVMKDEKWALLGRNGAGKSMLLSVIFADHPQAYANQIVLFDRPRGSGESIWEIREKIAYYSPELFLYSDKNKTCRELAYSMLRSNPYVFEPISKKEQDSYLHLMEYFSIHQFIDSPLHSLPMVVQRMAFLVAVFLKNAPLIILDEPFHGFDIGLVEKFKYFLNQYCKDRTFVVVSHRKIEIPSIVNRRLYLQNGKADIKTFH
jgi:molybdate transport system ATP-binding protein